MVTHRIWIHVGAGEIRDHTCSTNNRGQNIAAVTSTRVIQDRNDRCYPRGAKGSRFCAPVAFRGYRKKPAVAFLPKNGSALLADNDLRTDIQYAVNGTHEKGYLCKNLRSKCKREKCDFIQERGTIMDVYRNWKIEILTILQAENMF